MIMLRTISTYCANRYNSLKTDSYISTRLFGVFLEHFFVEYRKKNVVSSRLMGFCGIP